MQGDLWAERAFDLVVGWIDSTAIAVAGLPETREVWHVLRVAWPWLLAVVFAELAAALGWLLPDYLLPRWFLRP